MLHFETISHYFDPALYVFLPQLHHEPQLRGQGRVVTVLPGPAGLVCGLRLRPLPAGQAGTHGNLSPGQRIQKVKLFYDKTKYFRLRQAYKVQKMKLGASDKLGPDGKIL